jgi:ABC-type sugar transport system ATPase subunit
MTAAVQFDAITKRFPGVLALSEVSLDVAAGACHALCGENGAGKSTLAKVLAGIHAPDAGRMVVHGVEARFSGPRAALDAGVGIVHQELEFCDNLSVAENLCLSAVPSRGGFVVRRQMEERAAALLAEIGTTIDVRRLVGDLNIAQQQLVQIAAAVGSGARIIIFDEPTSSLSHVEAERLFQLIARLKQRAVTCVYVTHRMAEIFKLCDHVSVLRDGRHVTTRATAELSERELVHAMIGRSIAEYFPQHLERPPGDELLRVEQLSCPGKFDDISFALRAGEIVGLAGLVGAGRSGEERRITRDFFARLRVVAPGIDAPVAGLSGGNQQKIVLARWLAAGSRVLLLDEPTRGVDVGAKAEIHGLIDQLARQQHAILLISSELPEVLSFSTRILVLRNGRLVGALDRASATQDRLLRLMATASAATSDPSITGAECSK